MGPVINTFGNEMFPFLADNGDLYFASDGHPGFGGLDIFISHQMTDSTWLQPRNLNQPINSSYDDFSLCISKNNMNGIFSSNRPGGLGNDDLYLFRRLPEVKIVPNYYLSGYVKDKITLKPINNATVFFLDQEKNQALILKTDSNGFYKTQITPGKSYTVKAMQIGYIADCYLFTPDTISKVVERFAPRDLLLDMLRKNRTFVLENIYYDLDKYYIRPDAQPALNKLVVIMKENPVNIELGSHCDSRASDAYNMILSQNRAESAVHYIVSKGINPARITAKGYGESQLVNKCKNGVPCTEEEHQMNRRTEFKVISGYDDVKEETINLSRYKKGEIMNARLLPDKFFDICK
jgi:outer membrane protein OmpA-like peptidoglycan-associated protein